MSEGIPLPLRHARNVANDLRDLLMVSCWRIEVAGSIRREKKEVKDGEIVAIPRIVDGQNLLHQRLDELVEKNAPGGPRKALVTDKNGNTAHRWGDDFRKVSFSGMNFDIFMTDEDSWGYQYWLRTGPWDGNKEIMIQVKKLHAPIRFDDGQIWYAERRVPVREERDLFELLGIPFVEPKERNSNRYRTLLLAKGHVWGNVRKFLPALPQELRLIWNYKPEVLAAYPIPLDFIDEDTGLMWSNTSLNRRTGAFELVEKGSREARYQHEFLVGVEQRRVELNRLRQILWRDQKIPVPGYEDIGDLSIAYLLADHFETERVPLADVVPTQSQVYRWGAYIKAEQGQQWANWCYSARNWSIEQGLADAWGDVKALRFAGDKRIYLIDGHHRYMAARDLKAAWLSVKVAAFEETLAQACGMIADDEDNTNYPILAEVMEEALGIIAEGAFA